MPTDSTNTLRRRLVWSLSALLSLVFLTSTVSLSNEHRPVRGFSLGLDLALAPKLSLDLNIPALASPAAPFGAGLAIGTSQPATPSHLAPAQSSGNSAFVLDAPGEFHLRPGESAAAIGEYVAALPFGRELDDAARRYEIDVLLLASVVEAESSFRADAISPKGALGLMQLLPLHFAEHQEPFDPALNLDLGARYFGSLRDRYDGDVELALAAYHAGPGTIQRFGGTPPWKETRRYIDKVMTLYREHQENLASEGTAL